jgi:hypothetical protein
MKEIRIVPKKWANANRLHGRWRKWYKTTVNRKSRQLRKVLTRKALLSVYE